MWTSTVYVQFLHRKNNPSLKRHLVLIYENETDNGTGRTGFDFWPGQDLSLLYSIQTGPQVHPASYPVRTGALSPRIRRPERETKHSHQSSAEVKNVTSPKWLHSNA